MATFPGSEILTGILHVVSESLLIPVITFLILFLIYAIITFGELISEYSSRIKNTPKDLEKIIKEINENPTPENIIKTVEKSEIPKKHKQILIDLAKTETLGKNSREALARKFLENEELNSAKKLEKTDIVTKVGPSLGLMGTLIPMGPGLAALGSGDITSLASAIIVAFDTTVTGLASGAVAYIVSKIRRRWYEEYISNLDTLIDAVLEVMNNG